MYASFVFYFFFICFFFSWLMPLNAHYHLLRPGSCLVFVSPTTRFFFFMIRAPKTSDSTPFPVAFSTSDPNDFHSVPNQQSLRWCHRALDRIRLTLKWYDDLSTIIFGSLYKLPHMWECVMLLTHISPCANRFLLSGRMPQRSNYTLHPRTNKS